MTPTALTPPQAIPAAAEPAAPAAPPAPPPESELARINMSMLRRYPLRYVGYVVSTLAAFGFGTWAMTEGWILLGSLLMGGGLFLACRFAYWCLRMNNTTLVVTTRRVMLESGVLSRQASEFALADVSDIQVEQGLLPRMMGVGDLAIISQKGDDMRQMVVMAVSDPLSVAELIRNAKG